MVDLAEIKKGGAEDTDDAYDTGIGTTFSAETNKRDEDAEMWAHDGEPSTGTIRAGGRDSADTGRRLWGHRCETMLGTCFANVEANNYLCGALGSRNFVLWRYENIELS